jgi:Photosynthetic reaction centre cytochrome C subunit
MAHNQKTITLITLVSLAVMATAATITTGKKYKNLKVLPQDISERKLDSIMGAYTKALKVSCDFCHVPPKKDTFSITPVTDELDFALDNEMKENARKMMRMTIDINKNYFYFNSTVKPEYLNVISCNTCHRGNPYPINE